MSSITGYTQGFGEGTRTYNVFDIDPEAFAAAVDDPTHDLLSISEDQSLAPEQRGWEFYTVDFTAQGVRDLLGEISTLQSNILPISDYNSSAYDPTNPLGLVSAAWHYQEQGPVLPLPPDWGDSVFGGWAYKYCKIRGSTGFLRPSFFDEYKTEQQLNTENTTVCALKETNNFMFWSSEGSQIGVSHCWRYDSQGDLQEYVRLFKNANDSGYADAKTLGPYFVANDGALTLIYDPEGHPALEITHSSSASPRITLNWFAVNWQGKAYVGMVAIDHNTQNIPTRGKGFIVSNTFLTFDYQAAYNPQTSSPDHGIGHGIQDAQQFPGTNIGTNFDTGLGAVDPATQGLKLVKMNLDTLNEATNQFVHDGISISDAKLGLLSDLILDVYALPFDISAAHTSSNINIGGELCSNVGNVGYGIGQQFIQDMGSVSVPEPYGNYLDYEPYTTAIIGLPFCGVFEIPINSFMNGELHLYYSVDVMSGGCTAYVFGMDRNGRWHLIGQFAGQTKLQIPYAASAANITAMWNTIAGYTRGISKIATSAAMIAATGGAGAAAGAASTGVNLSKAAMDTTNHIGIGQVQSGLSIAGGIGSGINDIVQTKAYRDSQPKVCTEVIGEIGGAAGWNSFSIPYVKFKRVVWMPPEEQQREEGMPSNIRYTLSEFSSRSGGLCRAINPKLSIENANESELKEIQSILASGFYTSTVE